jgi:heme-binding NEAT domain protein
MNVLYVVQLVGEDMGAESRVISIKVTQLNDKLFSRVNIVIFLILRYFLYLRDVPKLYI